MCTPQKSRPIAPTRDGNIAIQEELDLAVLKNSQEALELFIRRHPDHKLVKSAKLHLNKLE